MKNNPAGTALLAIGLLALILLVGGPMIWAIANSNAFVMIAVLLLVVVIIVAALTKLPSQK